MFPVRGDDDAAMSLAHVKLAHEAESHELLAGASLGVAVAEIPACSFEGRSLRGVLIVAMAGSMGSWRAIAAAFLALIEVFLVPNHFENACES